MLQLNPPIPMNTPKGEGFARSEEHTSELPVTL